MRVRKPVVACWVLRKGNYSVEERLASAAVLKGWGKECSIFEFIDSSTNGIDVDWKEGYGNLASKSFRGWQYMFERYIKHSDGKYRVDFILKADLDTYILWHNLRLYLDKFDPHKLYYIGKTLNTKNETFVAGACIILTRASLGHFVSASKKAIGSCAREMFHRLSAEDVALGRCLAELGIQPQVTQDDSGAERFMVFSPDFMLNGQNGKLPPWYISFSANKILGKGCCSEEAIAFHYVRPENQGRRLIFQKGIWQFETQYWDYVKAIVPQRP